MLVSTTLKTIHWGWIVWVGLSLSCVGWMLRLLFHRPSSSLSVFSDIRVSISVAAVAILLLLAFHASSDYFEIVGALCLSWIIDAMLRLVLPRRPDHQKG